MLWQVSIAGIRLTICAHNLLFKNPNSGHSCWNSGGSHVLQTILPNTCDKESESFPWSGPNQLPLLLVYRPEYLANISTHKSSRVGAIVTEAVFTVTFPCWQRKEAVFTVTFEFWLGTEVDFTVTFLFWPGTEAVLCSNLPILTWDRGGIHIILSFWGCRDWIYSNLFILIGGRVIDTACTMHAGSMTPQKQ
jgi:hypothetical protein